ncbi:FecR family protein [Devosia limi]|uniref:FecR family protein n=1 Tax=Devosia limi DSM 17137 TaxID=1121477 RepID=A0A1M4VT43_9HYPH|nr:FecR domain-containing protein [Devosia limi]SHE72196.1 FecR family protein [Devosia limi DSM 17137]
MNKRSTIGIFLTLVLTTFCLPAFAANEGMAVGVNPDALAHGSGGNRTLVVGADISVGERVVTGRAGQVQIIFADQTRLVVGPGSDLLIEAYLMRNSGAADRLAINAFAGTFRFISGNSPKSAYQIRTPTAAIAVRGTKFDFIVTPRDTRVMLYEGALTMCGGRQNCVDLDNRCEIGVVSASAKAHYQRANPERAPRSQEFRYARFQRSLLPDFRISGVGTCIDTAEPAGESSGGSNSGDTGRGTRPTPPTTGPTAPGQTP